MKQLLSVPFASIFMQKIPTVNEYTLPAPFQILQLWLNTKGTAELGS